MKLTPQQYAQSLIKNTDSKNIKNIACGFWYIIQKNGQYRELPKILEAIDEEHAKEKNMILAKVYSTGALKETENTEIKSKLKKKFNKEILIKNILKNSPVAGVIVKVDDREIDLSLSGKINNLKQAFQKNC